MTLVSKRPILIVATENTWLAIEPTNGDLLPNHKKNKLVMGAEVRASRVYDFSPDFYQIDLQHKPETRFVLKSSVRLIQHPMQDNSKTLSELDIAYLCKSFAVKELELMAFIKYLRKSTDWVDDDRPPMIYHPKEFSVRTEHKYDLSHPALIIEKKVDLAVNYSRYQAAKKVDENAAKFSCSWGILDVKAKYFSVAGFSSVDRFIAAMYENEYEHVKAALSILKNRGGIPLLRDHKWTKLAKLYYQDEFVKGEHDKGMYLTYIAELKNA